jgi:phosphoglycolate phosphatase
MKTYSYILFDLDGTLTDPGEGIIRSVQYALAKLDIEEKDHYGLRRFIGPPLVESFEKFYGLNHETAWQAVQYYREYFAVKGLFENEVFPGIPELLAELKERNKTLAVATSKPTIYSKQILEHFKLDHYFDLVIGSNLDGSRVDKSEIIQAALEELSCMPNEAVMVGDRMHDIAGARKNCIDSIAVGFGYGSVEEFHEAGPSYVAETIDDLANLLLFEKS